MFIDILNPINNQLTLHEGDSFFVTKSYNTLEAKTKISFYSHVLLVYTIKYNYGEKESTLFKILATLRKCFGVDKIHESFRNPPTLGNTQGSRM